MLICIDFDDTYTADPQLWDFFIDKAKSRGHTVICATMRYKEEGTDVLKALEHQVENIIFTDRQAKKPFVESRMYKVDVWIDDTPEFLLANAG